MHNSTNLDNLFWKISQFCNVYPKTLITYTYKKKISWSSLGSPFSVAIENLNTRFPKALLLYMFNEKIFGKYFSKPYMNPG